MGEWLSKVQKRKMWMILIHCVSRHTTDVYEGKIDFKFVVLRHYFSRHSRVLRVLKNHPNLPKSPKSVSSNGENCVTFLTIVLPELNIWKLHVFVP